jgi:para-nitrobenzyl esterase
VETPFVFDNLLPALRGDRKLLGAAQPPQALADRMHRAWTDFVTSGSPGWSRYDLDSRATMRIGDQWTLVNDPFRAERAAWA